MEFTLEEVLRVAKKIKKWNELDSLRDKSKQSFHYFQGYSGEFFIFSDNDSCASDIFEGKLDKDFKMLIYAEVPHSSSINEIGLNLYHNEEMVFQHQEYISDKNSQGICPLYSKIKRAQGAKADQKAKEWRKERQKEKRVEEEKKDGLIEKFSEL